MFRDEASGSFGWAPSTQAYVGPAGTPSQTMQVLMFGRPYDYHYIWQRHLTNVTPPAPLPLRTLQRVSVSSMRYTLNMHNLSGNACHMEVTAYLAIKGLPYNIIQGNGAYPAVTDFMSFAILALADDQVSADKYFPGNIGATVDRSPLWHQRFRPLSQRKYHMLPGGTASFSVKNRPFTTDGSMDTTIDHVIVGQTVVVCLRAWGEPTVSLIPPATVVDPHCGQGYIVTNQYTTYRSISLVATQDTFSGRQDTLAPIDAEIHERTQAIQNPVFSGIDPRGPFP